MKNPLQVLHYCTATGFSYTATIASLVTFVLDGFDRGLHFDCVEFSSVSSSHHFGGSVSVPFESNALQWLNNC